MCPAFKIKEEVNGEKMDAESDHKHEHHDGDDDDSHRHGNDNCVYRNINIFLFCVECQSNVNCRG